MDPHLTYPPDNDLRRLLRFEPHSGAIWLGERRMVLLHTAALTALRHDLITSVGKDHARRLLTRLGYACGLHDAGFAAKTRGKKTLEDMFLVGPQLHMLEGAARVTPVRLEMDAAAGRFEGMFRWDDSWEAHAHRLHYGVVDEPACWTLLGYASGYTSAFMGRLILFKEIKCSACGDDHCLIEGRPIDDWPDGDAHRQYFEDDSLLEKMAALSQQVEALKNTLEPAESGGMLVGTSPGFQHAHDLMRRAATTQVTVLLTGETGVGKERFARALHEHSERAAGPFVAVNCAALPEQMFETLMFGHAAGAFPGAGEARPGKMEAANGGTLLLDEIEAMPLGLQAKLLRALQERTVERLGENGLRPLDLRIIATSKTALRGAEGFRTDLFFRLAGAELATPPLREAAEDIPLIFSHYAQLAARRYGRPDPRIPWPLQQELKRRAWPGNMRELKAAAEAHALGLLELRRDETPILPDISLADRVAAYEAREIAAALERHRGNTLRVAHSLGLPRRTLNDKMRRYGLISKV